MGWNDYEEEEDKKPRQTHQEAQEEPSLIKDRECINCEDLFDCMGKIRGVSCLRYKERRK